MEIRIVAHGKDIQFRQMGSQRGLSNWLDSTEVEVGFFRDGEEEDKDAVMVTAPYSRGFSLRYFLNFIFLLYLLPSCYRFLVQPINGEEVLLKTFVYPTNKEELASFCEVNQRDLNDPVLPVILLGIEGMTGRKLPLFPPDNTVAKVFILDHL